MNLFEEILNVLVFDVKIGVESDADGGVAGYIFLGDSVCMSIGVHSLAKDLLFLMSVWL